MGQSVTLEAVLDLARQLSPVDQVRLIEQIAPQLEQVLAATSPPKRVPIQDLWGLCMPLGPAPSAEEIDAARQDAWANFPRDDI